MIDPASPRVVQTLWDKLIEEFIVAALVCVVFLFHLRLLPVVTPA